MIEKGELDRLRQKQIRDYNPTLLTLANLREKMDSVLSDSKLSSTERNQLLDSLMTSFQSIKSNAPLSISSAPAEVEHDSMPDSAIC